jgi:hypothetical protein
MDDRARHRTMRPVTLSPSMLLYLPDWRVAIARNCPPLFVTLARMAQRYTHDDALALQMYAWARHVERVWLERAAGPALVVPSGGIGTVPPNVPAARLSSFVG